MPAVSMKFWHFVMDMQRRQFHFKVGGQLRGPKGRSYEAGGLGAAVGPQKPTILGRPEMHSKHCGVVILTHNLPLFFQDLLNSSHQD